MKNNYSTRKISNNTQYTKNYLKSYKLFIAKES